MKHGQDALFATRGMHWELNAEFTGFTNRIPTAWFDINPADRLRYISGMEWRHYWPPCTSMVIASDIIYATSEWNPVNKLKRYKEAIRVSTNVITKFASDSGLSPQKFTQALMSHIVGPGKNVPGEIVFAYCKLCQVYQLDPFAGHAALIKGVKPSVTIDGWTHIMNSHPDYEGCEFEDHCEVDDPTAIYAISCKIHHAKRKVPIVVTEYLAECRKGGGAWDSHPRRMLRHRALMQCARVAFGLPIQELDDLGNGANSPELQAGTDVINSLIEAPAEVQEEHKEPEPKPEAVDPAVNEVIDGIPPSDELFPESVASSD